MIYHTYDTSSFIESVEQLLHIDELSELHKQPHPEYNKLFEVGSDSSTIFHKAFYDRYREGWILEYHYKRLIINLISKLFEEPFLYQKFPTFRVHLPGNIAVGDFHTDAEFNHPEGEINFVIPLTNSSDTASVWVESKPGKKDFKAMKLKVGQIVEFDGNHLRHGNKVNETGRTRVSMDFRILPISKYKESENGSMTLNTKFKEGEYYQLYK